MTRLFGFLLGCTAALVLSSCGSWRDVGCEVGRITGRVLAESFIKGYNDNADKNHQPRLSYLQSQAILIQSENIGCLCISELAGAMEDYTEKKRAEYRTEAAYLDAHITDMKRDISRADREIAWLNKQSAGMAQQGRDLRKVPAMKSELKGKLSASVAKRKAEAQTLKKHLTDEKADSQKALATTSDEAKKAELRKQISELDKRITRAREAEKNILNAEHIVTYA